MKFSKIMHVISVVSGFAGVFALAGTLIGGADGLVFGVSKIDALFCAMILILIAIWTQIATIHHMMLEKKGQLI
jgi:hypothetical protein